MKIINRGIGPFIPYQVDGNWLELDGCLRLNLAAYELDEENVITVYRDRRGCLLCAAGSESAFVAEITVPARRFASDQKAVYEGTKPVVVKTAVPFDMELCTLALWSVE